MQKSKKAFGVWSAIFLGIGSMVGAGIFIVIGQAGAIAGNIVWLSFIFGGLTALLSGYSLAKLAIRYPSRGGIVEYLVQGFGEGVFSGSASVLFYFAQLVAIAAVAKSFGVYTSTFIHSANSGMITDIAAVGVVIFFLLVNLIGATFVAKSENIIVFIKVTILTVFAISAVWNIDPKLLSASEMPPITDMLFAIGLTFFAYQGFSVITNTVEDMENPSKTVMRAMIGAILIVSFLYILTAVAVLGNLPLDEVIKTKDYALAEAAKPIFGALGFKIMAATALLATASAINATMYATADIGYTMAKEGNLPKVYSYNVYQSFEGLIISTIFIIPMILFFNLSEITTVATLSVLVVQGLTHIGHLMRIKETGANRWIVVLAAISIFIVIVLTLIYTSRHDTMIAYYMLAAFAIAFTIEVALRLFSKRIVSRQIIDLFNVKRWDSERRV